MRLSGLILRAALLSCLLAPPVHAQNPGFADSGLIGKLEAPEIITDPARWPKTFNEAPQLAATLRDLQLALKSGERDANALEARAMALLRERGWAPDYVALRRQSDLGLPQPSAALAAMPLVVLAAARLGRTRLIDNLELPATA